MPRFFGYRKQHRLIKGVGGRRVSSKRFVKKRKLGKYQKRRVFKARKQTGQSKLGFALQMARLLPDQVYLNNYTDVVQVAGTTNSKAAQIMWSVQVNQSNTDTDAIQQPPVNLMPHDPNIIRQIMYQQMTVPAALTATQVGALQTAQVLIKSWSTECVITNIQTGPCELYHYRCIARRDLSGNPAAENYVNAILTGGFADTALAAAYPTGVTAPLIATTFGSTPFMNPRFTSNIKVIKTKKYVLNPGRKIRLKYTVSKPRLWKQEEIDPGRGPDGDGSSTMIRGVLRGQHFSVFRLNGTFASAAAADSTYEAGIGNASVGIIYQHKVHYATITPQAMQTSGINAVAGYSASVAGYPLPIMAVQPYSVINDTSGVRVKGTTFAATIQDDPQIN